MNSDQIRKGIKFERLFENTVFLSLRCGSDFQRTLKPKSNSKTELTSAWPNFFLVTSSDLEHVRH